jgi:hypothetical protein
VDGQQVTFMVCCAQNQPRYSRDAIALVSAVRVACVVAVAVIAMM